MRRFIPAALALTLGLAACNQTHVPSSLQSAVVVPAAPLSSPISSLTPSSQNEGMSLAGSADGLKPAHFGERITTQASTLKVGNEAMFPFGFYHVSWMSDAATRERDMREMSAAGFNTMTASVINDDDNAHYGEFLDKAAAEKMYVLSEGVFESSIPALSAKPAVLGWMVADDCNLQYTPQEVARRSQAVRSLDPAHPTYAALFTTYDDTHEPFFSASDLMGNMSYPIGPGDSIGSTYDMERRSVAASLSSGSVPMANLQAFAWGSVPGHDPSAAMPSPAEVYNMTYQAIAAGVRGILYYTYLDSYNSVRRSPAVWEMLKSIVPEMSQLSPMLLGAEPQYLDTNNGLIKATAWHYQSHTYLLLVNVASSTQPLYLPLEAYAPRQLQAMFAARGSGPQLNGTTLGGSLPPLAAQFYQLD